MRSLLRQPNLAVGSRREASKVDKVGIDGGRRAVGRQQAAGGVTSAHDDAAVGGANLGGEHSRGIGRDINIRGFQQKFNSKNGSNSCS